MTDTLPSAERRTRGERAGVLARLAAGVATGGVAAVLTFGWFRSSGWSGAWGLALGGGVGFIGGTLWGPAVLRWF